MTQLQSHNDYDYWSRFCPTSDIEGSSDGPFVVEFRVPS
jgi:hypothetical protein